MANIETNLDSWLKHLPAAYAYHQVITNDAGEPVDYLFLQANPAFEAMTGLKVEAIIGRRVTEVMPGIESGDFDWIGTFGQVALTGESCQVEQYAQPLGRWYSVTAYSDELGYFAVLFHDITKQQREKEVLKSVMDFSQGFLETENTPDFQQMTEYMRTFTGAAYAVFNLFDDNGLDFTTKAIAGAPDHLMKVTNILGFNPIGKKWPHDPEREAITQQTSLTTYHSLTALAGKDLSPRVVRLLEKTFGIGQLAIVNIIKREKLMGHFALIMPRGRQLENPELAVLYASQVGLFLDKVQYEDKLKESEEQHRRLFETMSPGVIYQDADGSIISANPAAEKMIGITLDQMKGKTSMDPRWKMTKEDGSFVPGSEHPAMMALRTGEKTGPLIRGIFIPERDEYVWLSVTAMPLFKNGETHPFQVYAVFDDITERKQAEEALLASKEQLETLSNNIPKGLVYQLTVDSQGNRRFTYVSAGVERMHGVTQEEMLNNAYVLYDQLLEDDRQRVFEAEEEAFTTLKPFLCEARIRKPDGEIRWLQYQSALSKKPDDSIVADGIAIDITERKQAEEVLKLAMQQAEAANQAKSRYLAHMNHEMRTPLNGFLGFVQLLERTRLDEEQQEFMEYIKQSATHLLGIINNVLDMATIEAGQIKLESRVFLLEEEIETALAPLSSLAGHNNTHLKVTMDQHLPRQVKGDANRLRQILLNLGGNAVKFTQKGQVHIALTCPETTHDHYTLELVVEDNGPGMTQETLDKLFQPFYQADDGSTSQAKGTGLGLTITKELVELMGGSIQVVSTLGKGTRVAVTLKLQKAEGSSLLSNR